MRYCLNFDLEEKVIIDPKMIDTLDYLTNENINDSKKDEESESADTG